MNRLELTIICILGLYAVDALPSCKEEQFDAWKVGKALSQGLSKETLLMHLDGSRSDLTPERMTAIRALIEDAYQFTPEQAAGWWRQRYRECEKESDA